MELLMERMCPQIMKRKRKYKRRINTTHHRPSSHYFRDALVSSFFSVEKMKNFIEKKRWGSRKLWVKCKDLNAKSFHDSIGVRLGAILLISLLLMMVSSLIIQLALPLILSLISLTSTLVLILYLILTFDNLLAPSITQGENSKLFAIPIE